MTIIQEARQKLIIGIDPGVKTGIAVKQLKAGKYQLVESSFIHRAMNLILGLHQNNEVFVFVEDARLRRWFGNSGREQLQGAGSIKRDCKIWEDFLTDNNIPFVLVKPSSGKTKWDADMWKRATGYEGRTNEHARDAAILIHHINPVNLKLHFR